MSLQRLVFAQFGNPRGALGRLAGVIMAHRPSNVLRNRWTLDLLEIGEDHRCLEVGCGPGLSVADAARRAPRGEVVGIDRSGTMIAQARRRNAAAIRAGRVTLFAGTLESLPGVAPFNRAWSVNVIQFVPDRAAFIAAMARHLRPGGVLATTYLPRHKGATGADLGAMAESLRKAMAAEFEAVRVEHLELKPVGAISVLGRRR